MWRTKPKECLLKNIFPFFQIDVWKTKLNRDLPSPLQQIEAWLQEVEELVDEELPASQNHCEAMAVTQEKMTSFKVGNEKRNIEKSILY